MRILACLLRLNSILIANTQITDFYIYIFMTQVIICEYYKFLMFRGVSMKSQGRLVIFLGLLLSFLHSSYALAENPLILERHQHSQ